MKVDVKRWAKQIQKEEGNGVEVMLGIVKDGILYTHVECKVQSMVLMVKEMGQVYDRSNPQRERSVSHAQH